MKIIDGVFLGVRKLNNQKNGRGIQSLILILSQNLKMLKKLII